MTASLSERSTGRTPNPWAVVAVTTLGSLLMFVNSTSVSVALPAISKALHAEAATADWFLLSYMLALAMSVLVFSRLSDMIGRRHLYLGGLVVMIVASLAASFATGPVELIALRAVQGIAAASIIPNANAIISDSFPSDRLAIGLSVNIMMASVASVIGPVVGGLLLEAFGWRSLFLVNLPFGVLALVLGLMVLRRDHRSIAAGDGFDVGGAVTSAMFLFALLLGVNRASAWGAGDPRVLGLLAASVVLFCVFVVVERRSSTPIVDFEVIRQRSRALAYATAFLMAFPQAGVLVLVVLYQQMVLGVSTVDAGLAAAVTAAGLVVTSPLAGVLARHLSPRSVSSAGAAIATLGYVLILASLTGHAAAPLLIGGLVLVGAGNGIFTAPNTAAIMSGLPAWRRGIANGVRSVMFNGAQTTGTAVALLIVATGLSAAQVHGYDAVVGPERVVVNGFRVAEILLIVCSAAAVVTSVARGGPWRAVARAAVTVPLTAARPIAPVLSREEAS